MSIEYRYEYMLEWRDGNFDRLKCTNSFCNVWQQTDSYKRSEGIPICSKYVGQWLNYEHRISTLTFFHYMMPFLRLLSPNYESRN